jgi:hypothetical protein
MSPVFLIEFAGKEAFLLSTLSTIANYFMDFKNVRLS